VLAATDKPIHLVLIDRKMASSTDSSTAIDEEVRQLYERYQAAESDAERRKVALEMGKLDGHRHAEIYAALENE
jgi:hypothetical protein